ncbi:Alkaline phosphatase synthesis sensor protein PhoR [compost metagenome]
MMMGLKFRIDLSEDYVFTGNRSLFNTLLMNVVNNAIKYNLPSGSVHIYDSGTTDRYQLSIEDSGQGMDLNEVQHAFQRFEKFQSEKEDSHGLGLSIVKSIASFHGIDIEIESQKNKGTRVVITFSRKG